MHLVRKVLKLKDNCPFDNYKIRDNCLNKINGQKEVKRKKCIRKDNNYLLLSKHIPHRIRKSF